MNLHAASAYALHLLTARSTAGHGVHSPWMFRFITEVIGGRGDNEIMRSCYPSALQGSARGRGDNAIMRGCYPSALQGSARGRGDNAIMRGCYPRTLQGSARGKSDNAIMREVESLRQEMLSDRRMVIVTDPGAGSSVMKNSKRIVRNIASAAAVPKREAALLARIAESLNKTRTGEPGDADRHAEQSGTGLKYGTMSATDPVPAVVPDSGHSYREVAGLENQPVILELGTSLGISTLALALGAPQRRVISVEGCPELAAIARENLRRHGALNAEVICMEFREALTDLCKNGVKVALAFIDGNHRGAAMIEYVHKIRQMGDEMIIIAHDIRMNRDMIKAWRSIVSGSAIRRQAAGRMKSPGDGQPLTDISSSPAPSGQVQASTSKLPGQVQASSPLFPGHECFSHAGPAKAPSLAPSEPAKTPSPAFSGQAQTPSPMPSEQEQAFSPEPPGPGCSDHVEPVQSSSPAPPGSGHLGYVRPVQAASPAPPGPEHCDHVEPAQTSSPAPPGPGHLGYLRPIQATLETLRMGMLFCMPSITPGHYRVRY